MTRYVYVREGFFSVTWAILKECLFHPREITCIVVVPRDKTEEYVMRRVAQNEGG